MNDAFDIIGDIHGHAAALERLLAKLGYTKSNGVYRNQDRRVIFLGDFVDRGPEIRRTLQIVRAMVDEGSALAVMGNHEFNALGYHTPDGRGGWLRKRNSKNELQHAETMKQLAEPFPEEWRDYLRWFAGLPLALDLGRLRVVHAGWNSRAAAAFRDHPPLEARDIREMLVKGSDRMRDRELLLNGMEIQLPAGFAVGADPDSIRDEIRTRWWTDFRGKAYREVVFPDSNEVPSLPIPDEKMPAGHREYPIDAPPVFIGHYTQPPGEKPQPITANVACLDYSVARAGPLVAYRFHGETELTGDHFVASD